MKRFSFLQKAMFAMILVLFPIFITFLVSYRFNKEHTKRGIINDLSVIAEGYEGQIFQYIEMLKRRVSDFSSDAFIIESVKKIVSGNSTVVTELNSYLLTNKMPLDRSIHEISVISLEGVVVGSTSPSEIGQDMSKEEFFIRGKNGDSIIADIAGHNGIPEFAVSSPVFDVKTNKPIGVMVNFVILLELTEVFNREFIKADGDFRGIERRKTLDVYLVNNNNLMIAEAVSDGIGTRVGRAIVKTLQVAVVLSQIKRQLTSSLITRGLWLLLQLIAFLP